MCVCVCLFACASTYPFVHVCVIWCVWCVVVKHICLQAISFAYFSQPVHWVSGSLMHTVFNWQLWYSWSPTVMVRYSLGVAALPDRHHAHLENESSKRVMVCVSVSALAQTPFGLAKASCTSCQSMMYRFIFQLANTAQSCWITQHIISVTTTVSVWTSVLQQKKKQPLNSAQ